ncbi:hypothetical protein CK203_068332 [Vitis vinifera]|uniref:Uncharacterized protein n=1 Tax=Vitis vinifera TaxID=29760 RepID=A0A438F3C7_VITVI|nr:hypothetical protein CK203_068332 [Vitis vinifera]
MLILMFTRPMILKNICLPSHTSFLVLNCWVLKNISHSVLVILGVNGMFPNYVFNPPIVIYKK